MVYRLRALFCGVLLVLAGSTAAWSDIRLPDIGEPADSVWTPAQEQRLGEDVVRNLRSQGKLVQDPQVQEYIRSVGMRLASAAGVQDQKFSFFVVKDPTINAFAAPGGVIAVNSGLILTATKEGELAAVLSHEMGHEIQHHLARAYADAGKLSLPTAAAVLAAILVGVNSPEAGSAAVAGVAAGSAQHQINFTRDNEREADRVGIRILDAAGYNPYDMAEFFGRMMRATRYYATQLPKFLQDHPVTTTRLAEARERAAQMPPIKDRPSLDFKLTQARLAVSTADDPDAILERYRAQVKGKKPPDAAALYGEALAQLRLKNAAGARAPVTELLRRDPDRLAYRLLEAQVQDAAGDTNRALATFADALRLYPGNDPATILYAQALLENGHAGRARTLLQDHIRNREPGPSVYRLLARACGDSGHAAEAHGYLAEAFIQLGQMGEALRQLNVALATPKLDYYLRAQLESRRKTVQEAIKQERKEK